jgi:hypothetical protein
MIEWAEKFPTWKTAVQAQSNLMKNESSASTAGDVSWSMVDHPDGCWCNDSSSSSGRKTTLQLPKNPAATTTIEDHSSLEQRVAKRHLICNYLRFCILTFSLVLGTIICLRMMHQCLVQAFIYVDRETQRRRFWRAYDMLLEGREMMESWQWWKTVIEFIYFRILASTIVGEC